MGNSIQGRDPQDPKLSPEQPGGGWPTAGARRVTPLAGPDPAESPAGAVAAFGSAVPPRAAMPRRPRATLAVLAGLLCPGLGHVYVGRSRRGAAGVVALLLLYPAMLFLVSSASGSPGVALAKLFLGATPLWVILLGLPLDAARLARRRVEPRLRGPSVRSYMRHVLLALGLLFSEQWVMRTYWLCPYRVPSTSMQPSLLPGDVVIAQMFRRGSYTPRFGDVVVFEQAAPALARDGRQTFLKRVAGVPGQQVEVRGGNLFIDGRSLCPEWTGRTSGCETESFAGVAYHVALRGDKGQTDWGPASVPKEQVFLLGDNRFNSFDSRHFGFLPVSAVRGRARRIYLSIDPSDMAGRLKRFGHAVGAE